MLTPEATVAATAREALFTNPVRFPYEDRYASVTNDKKKDQPYRYFRNANRLAHELPWAHAAEGDKRSNAWCTNDYVSWPWHTHPVIPHAMRAGD